MNPFRPLSALFRLPLLSAGPMHGLAFLALAENIRPRLMLDLLPFASAHLLPLSFAGLPLNLRSFESLLALRPLETLLLPLRAFHPHLGTLLSALLPASAPFNPLRLSHLSLLLRGLPCLAALHLRTFLSHLLPASASSASLYSLRSRLLPSAASSVGSPAASAAFLSKDRQIRTENYNDSYCQSNTKSLENSLLHISPVQLQSVAFWYFAII